MGQRHIIHVDMDAFFASVEQRDNAALRGQPVLVGGINRGVVCAASYEARRFGVHSAMAMQRALRLCPHATVVSPRHGHYAQVSREVFAIFRRFTPAVQGLSLDEAFLDVSKSLALFGSAESSARSIRAQIREETQLVGSAGVGPNKFIAKLASDFRKPDGLYVVRLQDVEAFLWPLPVSRLPGVGKSLEPKVVAAGFHTLGDLVRAGPEVVKLRLGDFGLGLLALARGHDERPVVHDGRAKSMSVEETFAKDVDQVDVLERCLLAQALTLTRRMSHAGLCGDSVFVKLKDTKFQVRTRRSMLASASCDPDVIFHAAKALLRRFAQPLPPVRLLGLGLSHLTDSPPIPSLFHDPEQVRRTRLEQARHALETCFGPGSLTRASLLG